MESNEAASLVYTRIKAIDPQNASKIMTFILQHYSEKDLIRYAFGPESFIISLVDKAKFVLGLLSNTLPASMPTQVPNNSIPNPVSSPRLLTNGHNGYGLSSSNSPSVWCYNNRPSVSPNTNPSLSYAAVVNGSSSTSTNVNEQQNLPFGSDPYADLVSSPGCMSDSVVSPYNSNGFNNKAGNCLQRSFSLNDGYKPCLYYAKGFCKNGSNCKFGHDGECSEYLDNSGPIMGLSNDGFDPHHEMLRLKVVHQQRLAAYHRLNYLQQEAQRASAALMMKELNRARIAKYEFAAMSMQDNSNAAERQIYLTFPADSTFSQEDVSKYFSRYGPVEDVRIPYQHKRMFGFVTFVFRETVDLILAKGNPHYVCDSRVLAKPYKEKEKLKEKKQLERGEASCSSPPELDFQEDYNFPFGRRMLSHSQEMLINNKQALDLQSRRLMNLKLLELNHQHPHNVSIGSPVSSSNVSQIPSNLNVFSPSNGMIQDVSTDISKTTTGISDIFVENDNAAAGDSNGNAQEDKHISEESEVPESLEHVLPDNLFASPTKSTAETRSSVFSAAPSEPENGVEINGGSSMANPDSSASLNVAPRKSCSFELPRLSSTLKTWETCMDQHGN